MAYFNMKVSHYMFPIMVHLISTVGVVFSQPINKSEYVNLNGQEIYPRRIVIPFQPHFTIRKVDTSFYLNSISPGRNLSCEMKYFRDEESRQNGFAVDWNKHIDQHIWVRNVFSLQYAIQRGFYSRRNDQPHYDCIK